VADGTLSPPVPRFIDPHDEPKKEADG
jgi:hypothetical protein